MMIEVNTGTSDNSTGTEALRNPKRMGKGIEPESSSVYHLSKNARWEASKR
jgi:hypothetical protein